MGLILKERMTLCQKNNIDTNIMFSPINWIAIPGVLWSILVMPSFPIGLDVPLNVVKDISTAKK